MQDVPLARIGSTALFTRQIDEAMLAGRIDLAVHSLKDLPTDAAAGNRRSRRSASGRIRAMRWWAADRCAGASCRKARRSRPAASGGEAQLLHARPDLRVEDIRGNVDTRLGEARPADQAGPRSCSPRPGCFDSASGDRIGERLPPEVMLPAPGQGALAVTARADDAEAIAAARAAVHHAPTALAVSAERAFLRRLEGGCQVPVAALATLDSQAIHASAARPGRRR